MACAYWPACAYFPACCNSADWFCCEPIVLDPLNIWVVGIDRAQSIEIGSGQRIIAAQFCRPGKTGQSIDIVGIGQQNLLPGLRRHIKPAPYLEGMSLIEQDLGCRLARLCPKRGVHRRKYGESKQNYKPKGPN